MEDVIVKATGVLLSQSEEALEDKDGLITSSVVKCIDSFSKINKLALAHRRKNYTDSKKEDVARELSKILFYTGGLSHLIDLDSNRFNNEALAEFAATFPEAYIYDTILCSLYGIQQFIDLSEFIFSDEDSIVFDPEDPSDIPVMKVDESEESSDMEEMVASIFSCVMLIATRIDLDFDAIVYNAKLIDKY